MAYDVLTKKRTSKDWSCNIGDAAELRARPPMKKIAVIGVGLGITAAIGYLFVQDRRRTSHIHSRLALPRR